MYEICIDWGMYLQVENHVEPREYVADTSLSLVQPCSHKQPLIKPSQAKSNSISLEQVIQELSTCLELQVSQGIRPTLVASRCSHLDRTMDRVKDSQPVRRDIVATSHRFRCKLSGNEVRGAYSTEL
jgi:hypothetical protein